MTDRNLSKLQRTFRVLGRFLVILTGVTVMIALGILGLGYYWLLVAPLFGLAFYMLAPRSWWITRFFLAWFPFAKELIHRQEQVDHNIAVVEKLGYTLKFYELCDIDQVKGLRSRLINSLPDVNTDGGRLDNCARNAAEHLQASHPDLPYQLLMLLYQDHHSSPPVVTWAKEKAKLIPHLAEMLSTSSHLKSRHYPVSYEKHDLEQFLRPLDIFTLDHVKKEIELLNELWSVISDYLNFLTRHHVASEQQLPTPGKHSSFTKGARTTSRPGQSGSNTAPAFVGDRDNGDWRRLRPSFAGTKQELLFDFFGSFP